jgi:hypothetical protein
LAGDTKLLREDLLQCPMIETELKPVVGRRASGWSHKFAWLGLVSRLVYLVLLVHTSHHDGYPHQVDPHCNMYSLQWLILIKYAKTIFYDDISEMEISN